MENHDIEYLLRSIDETLERNEARLKELHSDEEPLNNNPMWLKTQVLPGIYGELAGQLLFVKDRLRSELAARKSKKFYQFWK